MGLYKVLWCRRGLVWFHQSHTITSSDQGSGRPATPVNLLFVKGLWWLWRKWYNSFSFPLESTVWQQWKAEHYWTSMSAAPNCLHADRYFLWVIPWLLKWGQIINSAIYHTTSSFDMLLILWCQISMFSKHGSTNFSALWQFAFLPDCHKENVCVDKLHFFVHYFISISKLCETDNTIPRINRVYCRPSYNQNKDQVRTRLPTLH